MKVKFFDANPEYAPELRAKIDNAISKVIAHKQFINGPEVKEFEQSVERYLNVNHAIGCASGSDGLYLAINALDLEEGSEVITTPFSFFATISCITRNNLKPVFADIDYNTFNISPESIKMQITSKTKAILVVHLFGNSAEMDSINEIANEYGLYVIEDAAQAFGEKYDDKYIGSIGDVGVFSFFPTKNLGGMGDGGLVTTNNAKFAEKIRIMKNHGAKPKYYNKFIGMNSRLDTLQAAILNEKLPYVDSFIKSRKENAVYYLENITNSKLVLPNKEAKSMGTYNQFSLKSNERGLFLEALRQSEIGCAIYYPKSLHEQECFYHLGYKSGDFPITEKVCQEVFSIPVYPFIDKEERSFVASVLNNVT